MALMLQSLFRGLVSGMPLLLSPLLSDFSGLLQADYPRCPNFFVHCFLKIIFMSTDGASLTTMPGGWYHCSLHKQSSSHATSDLINQSALSHPAEEYLPQTIRSNQLNININQLSSPLASNSLHNCSILLLNKNNDCM